MLDVVDLFRERDTVDEIGVGAIRHTISDILFPGTSTLHTRIRYVLFVPWLADMAVSTTTSSTSSTRPRYSKHPRPEDPTTATPTA